MSLLHSVDFPQMLRCSWFSAHLLLRIPFLPVSERMISTTRSCLWSSLWRFCQWCGSRVGYHWIPQSTFFTLRPKHVHSLCWFVGRFPWHQLLSTREWWRAAGQRWVSLAALNAASRLPSLMIAPGPPCCSRCPLIPVDSELEHSGATPKPPCTVTLSLCILGYGLLCPSSLPTFNSEFHKFWSTQDFLSWFIQLSQ